jgi:hypothetical protein
MKQSSWIPVIARTGLISKGVVYCLLGTLAFMAAFEISGQRDEQADKKGVVEFVQQSTGGNLFLGLIAIGLVCYSAWRLIEAFRKKSDPGQNSLGKKLRYIFSGLVYLSFAAYAIKILVGKDKDGGGDATKDTVATLLDKPFGQWMVGIFALIIAGVGIYQGYYAVAGKYKKHVRQLTRGSKSSQLLLRSGKIGYIARGLVWLIIAWLIFKSAIHSSAEEAGGTGNAFQWLESSPFGSYLLGVLALGLVCYGVFNFIRARYESFE